MLQAKNVSKTYNAGKKIALQDFSIEVPTGSVYGLLGPNGAGKTTTIQMLLGTLLASSGTIEYFNTDFYLNKYAILKKVGYASGYDRMHPRLTVFQNLDIVGRIYGLTASIGRQRIIECLEAFGDGTYTLQIGRIAFCRAIDLCNVGKSFYWAPRTGVIG